MSGKTKSVPAQTLVALLIFAMWAGPAPANPVPFAIPPVDLVYPVVKDSVRDSLPPELKLHDPPGSELTERGKNVRGVYMPMTRIGALSIRDSVRYITKDVRTNAVILDMKDDRGRVTFTNEIENATFRPHGYYRKMKTLIEMYKKKGIYVIGRIVCFKDNLLVRARPETAMRDRRNNKIWFDQGGMPWLDPHSEVAHTFITDIAREAEAIGVDEIQLDYIRFPVEPNARYATFPNRVSKPARYRTIAALLEKVDREISIPLSIDVFGLTAFNKGDEDGLGQHLEYLAPHLDVISPMLYLANWPKPFWENPDPNRTYGMVYRAVNQIRRRLGDGVHVRPLLQGFSYRAQNFGVKFLQNQINAAAAAKSSGYLFWNQGGRYQKLATALEQMSTYQSRSLLSVRRRIESPSP